MKQLSIISSAVALLGGLSTNPTSASDKRAPLTNETIVDEVVYVETPLDTDGDGRFDRIYVKISRPSGMNNLPAILTATPYAFGGNNVRFHSVDVRRLPQDADESATVPDARYKAAFELESLDTMMLELEQTALNRGYASLTAHSVGTGRSTGCPTVGDESETLAIKAVIDWLNGRVLAYDANGREVAATWASGAVGMTGVSYNGTLPNMVATTGVEGLKAIVPVAAISSWYDYYRANGLVVGPGGYIGEDADVLGKFIVRVGTCVAELEHIAGAMGREHGDFSAFWQDRDYVAKAENVRAAVFIIHGQSDWNVRQRHAIRWWEALQGRVPLRMWLHRGGHNHPSRSDTQQQIWAWFDHYVKGEANDVASQPPIEVELAGRGWTSQTTWPHEQTAPTTLYLNPERTLSPQAQEEQTATFEDRGKSLRLQRLVENPSVAHEARLAFVTEPLTSERMLSGTPRMQLRLAVLNRRAANITVAVVEYKANGRAEVITKGWADPQNHQDIRQGEPLEPARPYTLAFDLEPKQHVFARGSRIGVVVTATDFEHTLRPDPGTRIELTLGQSSHINLHLSGE